MCIRDRSIIVGYSSLNAVLAKPLVVIIGLIVGGLVGGLIGFLKYRFNINEVVSSLSIIHILSAGGPLWQCCTDATGDGFCNCGYP